MLQPLPDPGNTPQLQGLELTGQAVQEKIGGGV
jgi:hypothetical protein